jgi:apolipoprotein N-acyltransferase
MGAILTGILLVLAFPRYDLGWIAWVALVPLFLSIKNKSLWSATILSYISGIIYFMGVFAWVTTVKSVTWAHYSVMGLYLGFYVLLFGFFFSFIAKRTKWPMIAFAPFLWVAVEYLRSNAGLVKFPPALLGYTQYQVLPLAQLASLAGVYGVSFIIVLANAALADGIGYRLSGISFKEGASRSRYKPVHGILITAGLILAVGLYGWVTLQDNASGKTFSLGVVQGNIPLDQRFKQEYRDAILAKYEELSLTAAQKKPELIIWPEASTPGFVLNNMPLRQRMIEIVRKANTYFVVGSAEYLKFSITGIKVLKSGNTALFFSPEGKILGQYLKIHLIPFGEYIPYEKTVPWPKFIVKTLNNSNIPGEKIVLFNAGGTRFGTLICSEVLYPDLSRKMVKMGADLLVNMSNEAWFGRSSFPYQFVGNSVFRAIENRVHLVKAANTGISCVIDPYGRVSDTIRRQGEDLFVEGTLFKELKIASAGSLYTRWGDILPFSCIGISLLILIRALFFKPRV